MEIRRSHRRMQLQSEVAAAAVRARSRARGGRRRVPRRAQHRARSDRGARRHRGARAGARLVGRARARVPRRAADAAQPRGARRGARQDRRVVRARRGPAPAARSARRQPAEQAQRATELAKLYDRELGDVDAAIRMLAGRAGALPDDARQQELLRLLRARRALARGRRASSSASCRRCVPTDVARQVAILLELGELRADSASTGAPTRSRPTRACSSAARTSPAAIAALETLYEQTRPRPRARAHPRGARRGHGRSDRTRASCSRRVATLRSNRGDVDGSLAAYTAAFAADPTNRDVFTAMERVCYKAERWAAAMQLYESRDRARRERRIAAPTASAISTRAAATSSSTSSASVDAAIASYQKVIEVDSQPAAAVKILEDLCNERSDWHAADRRPTRGAPRPRRILRRQTEALRNAAQVAQRQHARRARVAAAQPQAARRRSERCRARRRRSSATTRTPGQERPRRRPQAAPRSTRAAPTSPSSCSSGSRGSPRRARATSTPRPSTTRRSSSSQPENRDALDALGRIYESTEQWAEFIDVTRRQIKVTNDRNTKALLYFKCGSVMEAKFGREHDAIRYYDAAIKTSTACLPAVHGLRDLYRRREEWPRVIETLELEVKLWARRQGARRRVRADRPHLREAARRSPSARCTTTRARSPSIRTACRRTRRCSSTCFDRGEWEQARSRSRRARAEGDARRRSDARAASSIASAASSRG